MSMNAKKTAKCPNGNFMQFVPIQRQVSVCEMRKSLGHWKFR